MRIRSLAAFDLPVRLRKPIRHASHTRTTNNTLIVRCELSDGSTGWGEGLPRPYVTGETTETVWQHLRETDFAALAETDLDTVGSAVSALDEFQLADIPGPPDIITRECFGNSVRCAIELAVLDAVTRSQNQPLSTVITDLPEFQHLVSVRDAVWYSGVITSESGPKHLHSCIKMRAFGFRQVKVKVGTAGRSDVRNLSRVRRIVGKRVDIRLDANEAWHADSVVSQVQPLLRFRPSSLEQPVPHNEVESLSHIRPDLNIPIMLDESLCSWEDAQRAIDGNYCDLFNLRLSKCGGIVKCLRLAGLAKQHKLGWQLGCQVGETGILSAAGRHFACNIGDIRYLEGSYDRFLVRDSLTIEDLTFRYGGRAGRLPGPGLGITVREDYVNTKARRTASLIGQR